MKKLYISTLLLNRLTAVFLSLFLSFQVSAQTITNYSFAASAGTFIALSGSTVPSGTGTVDEGYFNAISIGFEFWYMGARYTTVSAGTNGWLTLGANITNATSANNLSGGGAPRPVIAPLWDDLNVQAGANVTYLTTGTAGSRIFTLQYLTVKWNATAIGSTVSFQIKLYEATGKIQFVYRQESGAVSSASASIGISGTSTGSGNFLSLNGTGTAPTASSTTETTTLNTKPATGQVYSFTPQVPVAPVNLSFTNVLYSGVTLNWQDFSSNETGFVIYRSTDGVNYTFITQTAANTTSSVQTGLTANTTYYWKVQSVTEGGLSTAIYGSNLTPCASPPAAPTVTSPVAYCQNTGAVVLTATGTNLLWGGVSGTSGGTATLTSLVYTDASFNNRKTNFTTTAANVIINSVDYYIPASQTVTGLILSIYNSVGTVIATSATNTTLSPGATGTAITNTFNYTLTTAGNYSIGVSAGSGNIGSDNPAFPITESTGSINITGVSSVGYRCFNNIQFTSTGIATAPVPATNNVGSTNYYVTQTVSGCTSAPAGITVNVSASPAISQIPVTNLIANYKLEGNANDATGNNNGTLQNAPSTTADRFGNAAKAYTFNGSNQYISTANQYVNPANFSISSWFKTSTTTGGKLIGFGNVQVGQSSQYDRHIYMNNNGQIYFGVYPSAVKTINSTLSYNDNNWHLATATLSSVNGMVLYIDGQQVAADPAVITAENYTGYWKIGFDNNNGWTSQPSSFYFNGTLDDVLIYQRALTAAEALTLFNSPDGAGNNGPVCLGSAISLSATTSAGTTYAWTGPNSFTSALQNPSFTYAAANAGVYTLVASIGGCTSTAYTTVISTSNAGQWTGNATTNWANPANWCSGVVPTGATNVIISSSAARMPSITTSVSCNSITINTGATLTIAAAATLNIAGTLTNNGTIVNSGTTNFNGTAGQQTFSGVNSFYNLTLNNTNGLLLPNAITVSNNLLLTAGIFTANNFNIGVAGNWTNNASTAAFVGGTATVTFNGTAAQTIGGTFATTFNNLISANTGSIVSLAVNTTISGNLTLSSGTFDLVTFTANRVTAGGTLTVANNAMLNIAGTNTFPSNYTTNTLVVASTVAYSGTNQTIANQIYGNLTLSSSTGAAVKTFPGTALSILGNLSSILGAGTSVTYTAASNISIGGNTSIGAATTFNGSSYTITAGGNWTNSGTFNGNTGTVIFSGPGRAVSGSGTQNFNNLTVSASLIIFSNQSISLSGNLATVSSGSFSQASGGTLLMTGTAKTISGTGILIDNLTVSGTVTTAASFNVTGNLSVSGSFTASTGIITMSGTSKTISGAGYMALAALLVPGTITTAVSFSISGSLNVNGSFSASAGTATFTGTSSFSGTASLFNVTINGTSLQLAANSILGIANTFTLTAGTLNVTSTIPNTVNFNGTGAQSINAISYNNLVLSNGNTKTAAGAISTNKDITIATGTTFAASSYTHSFYGNWINNGTFAAGTSTVQFAGPATAYLTGVTTFNILTSNTSSASTELILNNNISADIVNMTNGIIKTGLDTIFITNTRTGNGFIYGNIQRNHAFTTGVAYAFEGPANTVSFSTVTGVNSITVSAVPTAVADFPFGNAINRYYDITVPSGTYTATLRLHYEDGELNGNPENDMGMWKDSAQQWVPVGKTANDSIVNYVEHSGLTNMTYRWTCSINPTVVLWNGSVSSDWNTAANWTVYVGSGSTPPAATDVVVLGGLAYTYEPTISTTVNIKNLVFSSNQAVILTMAGGGSLTSGDMQGVWYNDALHTINTNGQTFTINGNMLLSDSVAGHSINLNIGSGIVNVSGSLEQSGGANINFSGTGILNIHQDFDHSSGSFTAGNGTVIYNGDQNQHVAQVNYNNLTINKNAGLASVDSVVNVAGSLLISAGELDNNATINIAGNVTISAAATFANNYILQVGGNWLNNGNYIGTGAQVIFNGSGTQTISATTFNNPVINKPVGSSAILTGNIVINGNLTITSGTLDIKSFSCDRVLAGGNFILADSATFIFGANNAPFNFTTGSLSNSSTVIADGTGPQSIFGASYGNVIFKNAGLKTLITPTTVNGALTIENGAVFDAGSQTLTLNGNWVNNGSFTPSSSTIICRGIGKTISGVSTFYRFSVYGSYTLLSNLTFDSLLIINSTGSLSAASGINVIMNGDLINSGILYTLGTTTFTGNVLQTLSLINAVQTVAITVNFNGSVSPLLNSTSTPQFGFLYINNTGGINPSVGWTIAYGLTIGSGASFNGGNPTHNILGFVTNNGTITSSGTMNFIPSSATTIALGNFSSTGLVVLGGSGALTTSGTTVSFHDVIVSNTNAAGITPSTNLLVTNNLTVNNGSILNAGNHIYALGGNMTNNGTVNYGTSNLYLNGTGQQNIVGLSALYNLTINKASGIVNLFTNETVNGALNFVKGKITTGNYSVIIPSGANVTGAAQITGWVNGNLQKYIATGATSKIFEIGDSNYYTPATIAFNNVTVAGNLLATSVAGDHPYISSSSIKAAKSVNRYWSFTNTGVAFTTFDATLQYPATDLDAGASSSLFGVSLYNGSTWLLPTTGATSDTSAVATSVTGFGDFAIGEICNKGTSISYTASPYCSSAGTASVTLTGNGGGTFSSTAGLSINASTGSINPGSSTPGTYSVVYTLPSTSDCSTFITSADITITATPYATGTYTGSPYCGGAGFAYPTGSSNGNGTFSSTAGLVIDGITGGINLGASTPGIYTVTYIIAAAGGCSQYQITTGVTILTPGTWSGAVSTDWNTSGNWICGAIPTAYINITIPSGLTNYPLLSSAMGVTGNITIQSGASLTVTGTLLQIYGSISNSGTFSAAAGTIEMKGTSAQTISSGTFAGKMVSNLIINNTEGVTLADTVKLTGDLTVANGSLNTGGFLILKSSDTATATVTQITSTAGTPINGNVTVERYIPGRRKYRLVTSAVTTNTSAVLTAGQESMSIWGNWQNSGINTTPNVGELITGGILADGFDQGTANASLYTYDDVNRVFKGYTSANGKNTKYTPLKAGIAYLMFVYGDRQNSVFATAPHNTVLNAFGTLKTGDQTYNTGSVIPISGVTGRFTLLGNPFASPVNWATTSKTNIANTYWGWDPNLSSTGGYITVTTLGTVTIQAPYSGNTGLNQYIQSGQGFFVKTTGASPVLTIREQDKVSNFNANAYRGLVADKLPLLAVNLQYVSSGVTTLADGVLAVFDSSFTNIPTDEDASKIPNTAESISILNSTAQLSIDARKMPQINDTLFLNVLRLTKPQYNLQIFSEQIVGTGVEAYLQDNYLNTTQPLSLSDTNNIVVNINAAIPASFDINRFRIVFHKSVVILPVKFVSIKASLKNKDIQVDWSVAEETGVQKYEVERSADGISFSKAGEVAARGNNSSENYNWLDVHPMAGNNFYRVRSIDIDGKSLLSKIVVVKIGAANSEFKIFPNPVTNHQINIHADEMAKGKYDVSIYNQQGQQIIQHRIEHTGGRFDQIIKLDAMLPAGIYYLKITGETEKYNLTIFIK